MNTAYPLVIMAMHGLGDSVFQRPYVRYHAERRGRVYLETSWPELFHGIAGVEFVQPDKGAMTLRTQVKNIKAQTPERWVRPPLTAERLRITYRLEQPGETIMGELRRQFKVPHHVPARLDAPDFGRSPVQFRRYAVLRPVTLRKEWLSPARAPDPAYIARAASLLQDAGYRVVTVADTADRSEWIEGEAPAADREFLGGELSVTQLGALVQHASVVVGGVGWIVPFALALETPAVFIGGGLGGYNAPEVVTDPRCSNLSRVRWLLPDDYCRCRRRLHACPKHITDFDARFGAALSEAAPAARPKGAQVA